MSTPARSRSTPVRKPFVRTAQGKVHAKFMIIACNAYLGRLVPKLYGKVMPVTSYIIATEPLGRKPRAEP